MKFAPRKVLLLGVVLAIVIGASLFFLKRKETSMVNPGGSDIGKPHADHKDQAQSSEHPHGSDEDEDEHEDEHKAEGGHHEHGKEHEDSHVSTGKAIVSADEEKGIELSPEAIQTIGVKTKSFQFQGSNIVTPVTSLVYSADVVAVYRLRKNHFKMVPIKLISKNGETAVISGEDFLNSDEIAIEGVALLRTADMDAFGGEASHGH